MRINMDVPERGKPDTITSGDCAGLLNIPDKNFITLLEPADYAGWQYSQVGLKSWLPVTLPTQVLQAQAPERKSVRTDNLVVGRMV
jgi:hypothetical protein